jgi:benzoate-CoA ligase
MNEVGAEKVPEEVNDAAYFLDENIVQGRGERIAVYCRDEEFTYNDIYRLSNKVGNVFRDLGVEIENRVYMALQDSPEFVATFYGVQKLGAGIIPAYTYLLPNQYEYELNLLRPKVVVADSSCIEPLREAAQRSKYPKAFLVLGEPDVQLREEEYDFSTMVEQASAELETEGTHKDDVAQWGFSGGSTGYPKGVPAPHGILVHAYLSFQEVMQYTENDIILSIPKLFFGLGAAAVLFPERTTPKKIFELIDQYRPTILIQVPSMMRKMLQVPKGERPDMSSIRLCTSGGEHLSAELYQKWTSTFGGEVIDLIGSAELGYVYISNKPGEVKPGSCGKPIPGYEAKVVDDEGKEVPDGETGVLMAKGPASVGYYWHGYDKSRQVYQGEWVNTGDLFKRDEEGYYYFAGRKDDLLKVSGIWILPLEIEKCLQGHPDIADCAVVGVKDEDNLDTVKAFVILREGVPGAEEKADQIKGYAKEKLSPYKFPRYIEFLDELPKNTAGKIDRVALRKRGI